VYVNVLKGRENNEKVEKTGGGNTDEVIRVRENELNVEKKVHDVQTSMERERERLINAHPHLQG